MIFSIDALLALLLVLLASSVFMEAKTGFDFSMQEVHAQAAADELALFLQQEKNALAEMRRGNTEPVQSVSAKLPYCTEVENINKAGECTGQRVGRHFLIHDNDFYWASVFVYFE
ncbi:hypothetical protein HY571_02060 [Candidatus Micrarchaeota archaeon]|nr:hypothetical protein [Candidatus Micrarchaeota archaeon]